MSLAQSITSREIDRPCASGCRPLPFPIVWQWPSYKANRDRPAEASESGHGMLRFQHPSRHSRLSVSANGRVRIFFAATTTESWIEFPSIREPSLLIATNSRLRSWRELCNAWLGTPATVSVPSFDRLRVMRCEIVRHRGGVSQPRRRAYLLSHVYCNLVWLNRSPEVMFRTARRLLRFIRRCRRWGRAASRR
jgi:hypothetical protein